MISDTPKWMYKIASGVHDDPERWAALSPDLQYEVLSVMMNYLDSRLDKPSRDKRKELITERLTLGEIT